MPGRAANGSRGAATVGAVAGELRRGGPARLRQERVVGQQRRAEAAAVADVELDRRRGGQQAVLDLLEHGDHVVDAGHAQQPVVGLVGDDAARPLRSRGRRGATGRGRAAGRARSCGSRRRRREPPARCADPGTTRRRPRVGSADEAASDSQGEANGARWAISDGKRSSIRSTTDGQTGDRTGRGALVGRGRRDDLVAQGVFEGVDRAHLGKAGFGERVAHAGGRDALAEAGEERRRHGQRDGAEALGVGRRGGETQRAGLADGDAAGAVDAEVVEHRRHAVAHPDGAGRAGRQAAPAVAAQLGVHGQREGGLGEHSFRLQQHAEAHRGARVDLALRGRRCRRCGGCWAGPGRRRIPARALRARRSTSPA